MAVFEERDRQGKANPEIGIVLIGRNEGSRLVRALDSVSERFRAVVYVDSGSTDDSIQAARAVGAEVVELSTSLPFTAARARNAGFERLVERFPGTKLVQFIDGDCELVDGWTDLARRAFRERDDVAVVCGRRRELFPDLTPYNRFLELEWDRPPGITGACGGDSMMRVDIFKEIGGFDPSLIAGEEPELCYRIRQRGWKVLRLSAEMTLHDAAMRSFHQFWRRCVRSGYVFAEGAWMYGRSPERYDVRELLSILFWGLLLPAVALLGAWPTRGLSLLLLLGYAPLYRRLVEYQLSHGSPKPVARLYARLILIGKLPEVVGVFRFFATRLLRRKAHLVEYK